MSLPSLRPVLQIGSKASLICFQEITDISESGDEYIRQFVERVWVAECSGSTITSSEETATDNAPNPQPQGSMNGTQPTSVRLRPQPDWDGSGIFATNKVELSIHVYQVQEMGAIEEFSSTDVRDSEDSVMMAHHWTLPCQEFEGIWDKFRYGKLLEINSHSLFSKWFSESGKMVQRMFDQIWSLVEDENAFVCVFIDEVESLAAARNAALSGSEPSDSIRVVNALLTQIDRLKQKKNVLILATSNITEAIDLAFIDRADIKMHIGLPSKKAIYNILHSSLIELQRTGIIQSERSLMNWSTFQFHEYLVRQECIDQDLKTADSLYQIAVLAQGMSGRTIRKLPFLAHAGHIQSPSGVTTMPAFLTALYKTVNEEQAARV
ncbi:Pachytene checkpoint protein 2 [Mortierella polycephala]|uniref:Pachytene checkpoint protein 2 n=1 Tax=Mortierella polycephala TaxID=41804 RepID=A0A9P6U794_9FUNG|nr:Pachytene checkpoint protein 2 [Mortierella polycephala]